MVQLRFETSSEELAALQHALYVADGVREADQVRHTVYLVSPSIYAGCMSQNGAIEALEIERKYEPGADAVLPAAGAFEAVGLVASGAEVHELHASYFDTPTLELATQRLALRRRAGGKDDGWHLKSKGEGSVRELMWPFSDDMPKGLIREVDDRLGAGAAERLSAIATVRTTRTTTLLHAETGEPVVEIADDLVEATNEVSGERQRWREWEAELMPGVFDEQLLESIEPLLIEAGATRARGTSKIQRIMSANGGNA